MSKTAIILHAEPGTHDAMGRAAHALLYTKELKETGHDVKLVLDGGGTRWIDELASPEHPLHPLFNWAKESGAVSGVCEYCVGAFGGDAEQTREAGFPLVGEYNGHPSVVSLVDDGYHIITL